MAPEVDSDDENVEYEDESGHRYRLYLDELEGSSNPGASCSWKFLLILAFKVITNML